MNNTTLESLEKYRDEKRKEHRLDEREIAEARKKIRESLHKNQATSSEIEQKENAENKSKELIELLKNKNFRDDIESVVALIFAGADVNYKEETKGDFPLLICARKGYLKTFYTLLRFGADVNLANNYLTTATMAAARHGNEKMLEMLILLGADVNAKCKDGDTALISAKRHDQKGCVIQLINAQAYLNAKNLFNQTVMDIGDSTDFPIHKSILEENQNENKFVTKDDAFSLIDEAEKKFKALKNN